MINPRNFVQYIGTLPKSEKFEIFYTPGDDSKRSSLRATIEVRRNTKRKEDKYYPTDLFQFKAFGAQADFVHNYVKRGDLISVIGENHKEDNYTKKDGSTGYGGIVLYADTVAILNSDGTAAPVKPAAKDANDDFNLPGYDNLEDII